MLFAAKYELLAAIPQFRSDVIDHWIIAVRVRQDDFASAVVKTLDDDNWLWGHYLSTDVSAIQDAYIRANLHILPWDELAVRFDPR